MYPVSAGYKLAVTRPDRVVRVQGTITLKNSTVINVGDGDFVQGTLYVDERCVSGEDIEVGNVYASELGAVLTVPLENPYSLDGARVNLLFGIDLGNGSWEDVPLGLFYVYEIERTGQGVGIKALDGMVLFDRDHSGAVVSGTPYAIISSLCTKAGVTLATPQSAVQSMPNGNREFTLGAEDKVKTCRDVLMWVCQLLGAFARMNRSGQLEIVPVSRRTAVKPVFKQHRFSTKISDFDVQVTGLAMDVGGEKAAVGSEDYLLGLEENPYLVGQEKATVEEVLEEILAQLNDVVYAPCTVSFHGDPALQAGDWVVITETGRVGGDQAVLDIDEDYFLMAQMFSEEGIRGALAFVTHSTWRYRGAHQIRAAGKASIGRGVQNQTAKAVQSAVGIAREAYDAAVAASEAAELINNAIQGYVLIRQKNGNDNEILIMDNPDPAQAVKVWRWNMGGLGYSDNCTGVDNPNRQYIVAMTMNGEINADFLKVGSILTNMITITGNSNFYWSGDYLYIVNPSNSNEQVRLSKEGMRVTRDGGVSWSAVFGFSGLTCYDAGNVERARFGWWTQGGETRYGVRVKASDGATTILDDQGILQTWQEGRTDNIEYNYPLVLNIYLPSEIRSIYRAILRFKRLEYRAYEISAAAGGGTTATSSSGGGTTVTSSSGGGTTRTSAPGSWSLSPPQYLLPDFMDYAGSHSHGASCGNALTSGTYWTNYANEHAHSIDVSQFMHSHSVSTYSAGSHAHSMYSVRHTHDVTIPDHTHTVTVPNHTHTVTVPNHTHDLVFGIQFGPVPSNITIKINGVDRTSALGGPFNSDQNNLNIAPYLTVGQWNTIEIGTGTSGGIGRIDATVFLQALMGVG